MKMFSVTCSPTDDEHCLENEIKLHVGLFIWSWVPCIVLQIDNRRLREGVFFRSEGRDVNSVRVVLCLSTRIFILTVCKNLHWSTHSDCSVKYRDRPIDPTIASAFLWRYEPVRRTGKSDDWLTIFCSHNKVHCSEIPIVLSNLLNHYFFIELWHILILWLAKMPNGGMPVFTLIATGWRYRKIFFYKKSTDYSLGVSL